MRFCGVDPGLSGAIACVGPDRFATVSALRLIPGPDGQDELDGDWLRAELERLNPHTVAVERVQGFGGCSSSFKLGMSYGAIVVTALSLRMNLIRVRPQTWQAAMLPGIEGRDRLKKASVALVRHLHPHLGLSKVGRCKPDDKADALLIAEWARKVGGRHG